MKRQFAHKNFRPASLQLIKTCDEIIEDYQAQGLQLTLRQLYYQLVSRNVVPNTERSYKNVGSLVSDARLAGLLDWNAIEDRVRRPRKPAQFESIQQLVDVAIDSYRLNRWREQKWYVELWVEKDALAGVLEPLASEYHVTLMVNRGYSSQSAMYDSANRFRQGQRDVASSQPRPAALLYLGDHDPSGEDMVRDIEDRLRMFGVRGLTVEKVALTMDQIEQYDPPPNPAKMSDSRAAAYVEKHGGSSWELDALKPEVLQDLVREAVEGYVDLESMQKVKDKESADKQALREAAAHL